MLLVMDFHWSCVHGNVEPFWVYNKSRTPYCDEWSADTVIQIFKKVISLPSHVCSHLMAKYGSVICYREVTVAKFYLWVWANKATFVWWIVIEVYTIIINRSMVPIVSRNSIGSFQFF